jgi:calcineurin-like phosphoesterase family protein
MIKYIRIASDLHLEGFVQRNPETLAIDFLPRDDRDPESILVLAGDISSAPDQLVGFLQVCLQRFPQVIFIAGNHEYYKHDYKAWNSEMSDRFQRYCPGLIYALGAVGYVEIEDVRFIYGTLWGDGGPTLGDEGKVGFYLNDFRLISNGETSRGSAKLRFTVQDMKRIYQEQKATIDEYLKMRFSGKTVVITHHLPSRRLVSERFLERDGSDGANGGFVGDCDSILAYDHAPDLWIHGHTHDTIDTKLWETRIICNPCGYRGEWNTKFNTFMEPYETPEGKKFVRAKGLFVNIGDIQNGRQLNPGTTEESEVRDV